MKQSRKTPIQSDALLIKAAAKGDLKSVRQRLAAGADVNAAGKGAAPALFAAVSRGHLTVVEALVAAGAEVNFLASGGSGKASPLSMAIENGHWEITQVLLKAGAQMGLEHFPGENAVGEAAENAIHAWYCANAPDEGWDGKRRSKMEKEKFQKESNRWMQFVRTAIAAGVKVRDYWLWSAAKHGFEEMVGLLIQAGTNVNAAPHISSALESAVEAGHLGIVRALLHAKADFKPAKFGAPLLVRAAAKDRTEIAAALLDAGAGINEVGDVSLGEISWDEPQVEEDKDAKGNVFSFTSHFAMPEKAEASSALIVAVRRGNAELVKLLVARGADPGLGDRRGVTAVTWATRSGRADIASLLKAAGGAEAQFAEGSGASALLAAAQQGDAARIEDLLRKGIGADSIVEDSDGRHLPLVEAAGAGHLAVVQALLNGGADPNGVAQKSLTGGITALMLAAQNGNPEVVRALLSANARHDLKDYGPNGGGESAIHYAARGGKARVIQFLLAAGASPNAKAKGGITPLVLAVSERNQAAVEALISAGADVNAGPGDGSGPLWNAAENFDLPMVELLLKHGASPVPKLKNPTFAPLSAAAAKGSVVVVKRLLTAGAPINAASALFGSALSVAALRGHADVVGALLEAGADPNQASSDGSAPLMAAVCSRNKPSVEALLAAGADPNRRNESEETALDLARRNKARSLVDLLEKAGALTGKEARKVEGKPVRRKARPTKKGEDLEQPDFSAAAQAPGYKAIMAEVAALCASAAQRFSDIEGCYAFKVKRKLGMKLLAEHHRPLLDRGANLFRKHRDYLGDNDKLALVPTSDWADLIALLQTNGANYGLSPAGVVKWLKELQVAYPFELTGGGLDWLEGRFLKPVTNARKLAHQMYEFCPDIVDQGVGSIKDLARALQKKGEFYFWWD